MDANHPHQDAVADRPFMMQWMRPLDFMPSTNGNASDKTNDAAITILPRRPVCVDGDGDDAGDGDGDDAGDGDGDGD
jgi:hypothetical protein